MCKAQSAGKGFLIVKNKTETMTGFVQVNSQILFSAVSFRNYCLCASLRHRPAAESTTLSSYVIIIIVNTT